MKFLVPNYSCLQNPWLGGYRPQIPVLSVLCPQMNLLNPSPKKFLGTPLRYVTVEALWLGRQSLHVAVRCTTNMWRTREYNRLHSYALIPRKTAQRESMNFQAQAEIIYIGLRLNHWIYTSRFFVFWWLVIQTTKDVVVHDNINFVLGETYNK